MALEKITPADLQGKGVVGLPAVPGLDAPDMQRKFDEIATDVIVPKFNRLAETLAGGEGAASVGAGEGTVAQALAGLAQDKADRGNVLEKDNAAAYTPSQPYHPATKQYVDNLQFEAGAGDMIKAVYDTDQDGRVNEAEWAQNADRLGGIDAAGYALAANALQTSGGTLNGDLVMLSPASIQGRSGAGAPAQLVLNAAGGAVSVGAGGLLVGGTNVMSAIDAARAAANAAMPKAGGAFTGNVTAYSTNRDGWNLRNSIVQTSAGGVVYTNSLVFRRK